MAVPKNTETMCKDGSMQTRHDHTRSLIPTAFSCMTLFCRPCYEIAGNSIVKQKEKCRDGVTCVVFVTCLV